MNAEALEKTRELRDEMDANGAGYFEKVGDLVIDPDTGEIIEFPENLAGAAERMAWLALQWEEANGQAKEWEATKARYTAAMDRLLTEMDVPGFKTERHSIRRQAGYAKAHIEKLPEARITYELSDADTDLIILSGASALNAKRLEQLIASRPDLKDALLSLIDQTKGFLRVERLRRQAPEIQRVTKEMPE